jgi:hypothetical protein
MKKDTSTDRTVAYLSTAILVLIAGILIVWIYIKNQNQAMADGTFANVGPLSFQAKDFTIRTSLAIQSSNDGASWVDDNKVALQALLQQSLERTEPALMTAPGADKLTNLQAALTKSVSASFPKAPNVQILVTDFVTSQN